jgi:hypothetical protein
VTVECTSCHQLTEWSEAWTVRGLCPACRSSQYGAGAHHEQAPLCQFEPVPMAGQIRLEDA